MKKENIEKVVYKEKPSFFEKVLILLNCLKCYNVSFNS